MVHQFNKDKVTSKMFLNNNPSSSMNQDQENKGRVSETKNPTLMSEASDLKEKEDEGLRVFKKDSLIDKLKQVKIDSVNTKKSLNDTDGKVQSNSSI